jgi:hypothetical protein
MKPDGNEIICCNTGLPESLGRAHAAPESAGGEPDGGSATIWHNREKLGCHLVKQVQLLKAAHIIRLGTVPVEGARRTARGCGEAA